MFNNNSNTACTNLKYIDLIGGSINGTLEYFATGCGSLERINANFIPGANNVSSAFSSCIKLKKPPTINLNDVVSAYGLFSGCSEITEFDYYINNNGSITNTQLMFQGCSKLKRFVSNQKFDFSQATNQSSCFYGCNSLISAPAITFGNGSAASFFYNCTSLVSVQSNINANNISDIGGFFYNCSSLVDGPTVFDAANATNVNSLFEGCNRLETAPLVISFPKATTAIGLFRKCYSLNKAPTTITLPLATDIREMFKDCNRLVTPPNLIESNVAIYANSLFYNCSMLTKAPTTMTFPVAQDVSNTFCNCSSIINGPNRYYAPLATNANGFFTDCTLLQNAGTNFEIGNNNPGKCTFIDFFKNCTSLTTLPTEGDMNKGTNYSWFFYNTGAIAYESLQRFCGQGLTFPNANNITHLFNTSKVIRVPSINGPNITAATAMFQNTQQLESIGDIIIPSCYTIDLMFNNAGQSLLEIGKLNVTAMTTSNGSFNRLANVRSLILIGLRTNFTLNNARYLTSVKLENPQANFIGDLSFQTCAMDSDALDTLFNSLPDRADKSNTLTVNIKGNPGAQACNRQIAIDKN